MQPNACVLPDTQLGSTKAAPIRREQVSGIVDQHGYDSTVTRAYENPRELQTRDNTDQCGRRRLLDRTVRHRQHAARFGCKYGSGAARTKAGTSSWVQRGGHWSADHRTARDTAQGRQGRCGEIDRFGGEPLTPKTPTWRPVSPRPQSRTCACFFPWTRRLGSETPRDRTAGGTAQRPGDPSNR